MKYCDKWRKDEESRRIKEGFLKIWFLNDNLNDYITSKGPISLVFQSQDLLSIYFQLRN